MSATVHVNATRRTRVTLVVYEVDHSLPFLESYVRNELFPLLLCGVRMLELAETRESAAVRAVRVSFVPCAERRLLPAERGGAILPEHVNGGMTLWSPALSEPRILVYRMEDAGKVLLHELIHLYGFDAGMRDHSEQEVALARRHGVFSESRVGLGEAYVDLLACHAYSIWRAARDGRIRDTDDYLERTGAHLDRAARTLLSHFPRGEIRENTHAFAYYVCKAALWRKLPDVLRSLSPASRERVTADEFVAILAPALDAFFDSSSLRPLGKNSDRSSSRSLRMTCF